MNRMTFILVGLIGVLFLSSVAYLQHLEIKQTRLELQTVEAERDAAHRAIDAMAAERAAADRRNRASVAGKKAIDLIPEGKQTPASETLLKSMQIANEIGGLK